MFKQEIKQIMLIKTILPTFNSTLIYRICSYFYPAQIRLDNEHTKALFLVSRF